MACNLVNIKSRVLLFFFFFFLLMYFLAYNLHEVCGKDLCNCLFIICKLLSHTIYFDIICLFPLFEETWLFLELIFNMSRGLLTISCLYVRVSPTQSIIKGI